MKKENNSPKPHIVLCAPKKTGKTTLIERIIKEAGAPAIGPPVPVYGFQTKRFAGSDGVNRIYMFPVGRRQDSDFPPDARDARCIGSTCGRVKDVCTEAFDKYGVALIQSARPRGLLIMDEIGHMEKDSPLFLRAVFEALNGDIPVLASVRYTAADAVHADPTINTGRTGRETVSAGQALNMGSPAGPCDYLERIKHHPRVRLYMLTEENRDAVYAEVRNSIFGSNTGRKEETDHETL